MKDKEIKKRITELVEAQGGNQSKFARELGIKPGHLSMLMATDTGISSSVRELFAKIGVNMQWFYTGTGEMWANQVTGEGHWESKYIEAQKKLVSSETELKDAHTLIDSLERILKK